MRMPLERFDPERLVRERVRLVPKADSRLMRACAQALRPLGNRAFMTRYWTTIGSTIYYPACVPDPLAHPVVLEHELVHVQQWRRWGVLMWISYLLLPLPIGLCWFRFRWEREAYLVELAHASDLDGEREREITRIVDALWFGYAFPWPRPWMRRWFERELARRGKPQR